MTQRPVEQNLPTSGFVLLDTWNGQALDKARWEQEVLAGTNSDLISPQGVVTLPQYGQSLLINGGMEVYAVGAPNMPATSPDSSTAVETIEGWRVLNGTAELVGLLRPNALPAGALSPLGMKLDSSGAGTTLRQIVFNAQQYRGMRLSATATVYGAACALAVSDGFGNSGGTTFPASAAWVTQSCSLVVGAFASTVTLTFTTTEAGTRYIDNCVLTPEIGAVPSLPRSPAWEYLLTDTRKLKFNLSARWRSHVVGETREFVYRFREPFLDEVPTLANFDDVNMTGANWDAIQNISGVVGSNGIVAVDADGFTFRLTSGASGSAQDSFVTNWRAFLVLPNA